MTKSINWPTGFREEVIAEDDQALRAAVRPGRLYFDNRYWVEDEVVLVRVNHRVIREATVVGDLYCGPLKSLSSEQLGRLKSGIQDHDSLRQFLEATYNQPVTLDDDVTLVTYRNAPLDPELMDTQDDSHMA